MLREVEISSPEQRASAPVHCRSVLLQCCAPQVGHRHSAETQSHICSASVWHLRRPDPGTPQHGVYPSIAMTHPLVECPATACGTPQHGTQAVAGHSTKGWVIAIEQTVAGLQGLPQPKNQLDEWQRAWDEVADGHLEGEGDQSDIPAEAARRLGGKLPVGQAESSRDRTTGVSNPSMTLAHLKRRSTLHCWTA